MVAKADYQNSEAEGLDKSWPARKSLRFRLFFLLVLYPLSVWADVNARLDRESVFLGDRIVLTIEAAVIDQVTEPDLKPLEQDFNLLGTSSGRQTQILNGQRSDSIRWSIQLEPKRTGTITIPAIALGQQRTSPLTVRVEEPQAQVNDPASPLFLEVEVQAGDRLPYVQQQILYSARLYLQQPLISGTLSAPQVDQAVVEQLGEQSVYRTTRNGKEMQVIERNYAIFPETSGELRIAPLQFTGRISSPPQANARRSQNRSLLDRFFGSNPFGAFDRDEFFSGTPFGDPGVPVSRQSKEVIIPVQPRPASYTGRHWLPAKKLELHDSWEQQPPTLRAGEPITRTVSIQATGLEASQIPALDFAAPPAVRIYPEQPTTRNSVDKGSVVSRSEQALAYIPERAGEITFPEIRLEWWDTQSDSRRVAVVPARIVQVAAGASGEPVTPSETPTPASNGAGESSVAPDQKEKPTPIDAKPAGALWGKEPWLAAITIALLLVLLGWWLRHRHRSGGDKKRKEASGSMVYEVSARKTVQKLGHACSKNDATASAQALLELASVRWPNDPPRNLGSLAKRVGSDDSLIRELERALYAEHPSPWQGDKLWQEFKGGFRDGESEPNPKTEPIAPLYPG